MAHLNTAIVNPARLTPYLADNICMACHQTGDARVLKPGKSYRDFRPGHVLDDTLSILLVPPTRGSPPSSDHVEHYYSMTLSKCYRASQGRLSCITCHDPHVEPSREEAPAYFRSKCLTCHTNQSCKLPIATRVQQTPANDCTNCHMPKRDIQVISHSSATNHRIVATPDEPYPDVTFQQTSASLPDLIHLNPAPGKEAVPPPLLTLLAAYGELAEKRPEYVASYLKVLSQLEGTQPDDPLVQAALGRRDLRNGDFPAAVSHLRRALQGGTPAATTYADLADALAHLGQADEAVSLIEKAIELDPFNPVTQKMLVVRLIDTKQYAKAHEALRHYLEVFPQDDFMRQMLSRAERNNTQP
ncbi:MAG TPA: tetratricopeptide repeat protein [Terracidiphilus sp.]|nr:tetratricopeptide repeat protein [Terracidiphilus sp.]